MKDGLGYDGALNNPFVFFSFGAEGMATEGMAMGNVGVMTAVPFSDATMLAMVSEAAAAAALRDVGAAAACASARTAGSTSGKPMAGVRRVLMGSRSGSATPRLPRVPVSSVCSSPSRALSHCVPSRYH
jgi:hypothetical protein